MGMGEERRGGDGVDIGYGAGGMEMLFGVLGERGQMGVLRFST